MRTRCWIVSALTVLMLQLPRHVLGAETRPSLAIEQTAEVYRKAVLAGDVAAVGATYRRDAIEMPPNCPPLKGRAAIEQYYRVWVFT